MITATFPEIAVVPGVLADRNAELPIVQLESLRTGGGFEVAVLIEDIVSR